MKDLYKALLENTTAEIMVHSGINIINKNEAGFRTSVEDNRKLIIGCMCFHCMENMVIFSDKQIDNINNIVNKL